MPQLGPAEVLVILVVALLVFGPKRLPEVGRQVGRGLRELRKVQDTVRDEINSVLHHDDSDDEPPRDAGRVPTAPGATSGQHAPSRFRPAAPGAALAAGAAPPPTPTAGADAPPSPRPDLVATSRPTHAPSRFRAPGR